ncbi:ATP-binding cassette domain-containing protein [Enterococcus sp. BWR-S5]|uniref:ATP-binding cassette domain-containing protein n=1 Tax=Enterococcus sp. BWR-S5 TaxID=2787714 RepID=UPI0019248D4B|nr:ATP-binding cassette domain-containing protein [Enterococcus sp. BWR-S5]MBL1226377.1 ATP-binding cassette domain-containing protein [Enterococcus sp. BWR-S5]
MSNAIEVKNLKKSFADFAVIKDVSFSVPFGKVFALLGTNGAGKTTIVRMLTTLLKADAGQIKIVGHDSAKESRQVRNSISLTGQTASVDEILTGRENLELIAKLRHQKETQMIQQLLERFDLIDAADRSVQTYSGGMKRKLDLAMSLLGNPKVLFLDEPTTGLDPQARATMWQIIQEIKAAGVTIFLTTQYLEEADQLADQVAILNHGKIAVQGSLAEVKTHLPQGQLELTFLHKEDLQKAQTLIDGTVNEEQLTLTVVTNSQVAETTRLLNELQQAQIFISNFEQKQPTLNDVFFDIIEKERGE